MITGGTGFLGKHLINALTSKNIFPTLLVRNVQNNVFDDFGKKLNLVEGDLLDFDSIKNLLDKIQPDVIIHLAGCAFQKSETDDLFERLNFEATANLLELANRQKVKRFIFTGTADEYGFQPAPQSETTEEKPVSAYAVSKNKAVQYALKLYYENYFPVTILRPFTIYGINQPARMFVSQAIDCAVRGIDFEMSEGLQKRDLLFVSDFVNAIIKLLEADEISGEIYNVGSGRNIALKDLALTVWKIAGANEKLLKIGARKTQASELHNTQADITKISKKIDWQPEVSLDEGLKLIIEKAKMVVK